jgi:hypothetical protein
MEVSDQHHAPAALPPGKEPQYPLDRRLGGPQSQSGHGGEEKNSTYVHSIERVKIGHDLCLIMFCSCHIMTCYGNSKTSFTWHLQSAYLYKHKNVLTYKVQC